MKCTNCNKNDNFSLIESSDDYHDGYVMCDHCGENIATFNFLIEPKEFFRDSEFQYRTVKVIDPHRYGYKFYFCNGDAWVAGNGLKSEVIKLNYDENNLEPMYDLLENLMHF